MQRFILSRKTNRFIQPVLRLLLLSALPLLLGGCDLLFGSAAPEPTVASVEVHRAVPTFTPTPVTQAEATPVAVAAQVVQTTTTTLAPATPPPTTSVALSPTQVAITPTTIAQTVAVTPTTAVAKATGPQATVNDDLINIRSGPATTFDLVGSASKGQTFQIVGKNPQGDWWQICCVNGQKGWVYSPLVQAENADQVAVAADMPTAAAPTATPAQVAAAPTATPAAANTPAPAPATSDDPSAGNFDPNAAYQIVEYHVLGLNENNGGIRDSRAQHLIFVTVLDANGNGVDGAVVKNLVGDHSEITTGGKGPGKAEITMYYDPFKLTVASDPSGPTTSQVSNQMGLAFPHLPDIVGKLGGTDYEYAVCPTLEINCQWPIHAVHYSYQITFKKVK
ncbi:MAG: SH3 domain-containing protein [Caldilineaceae bacterium]